MDFESFETIIRNIYAFGACTVTPDRIYIPLRMAHRARRILRRIGDPRLGRRSRMTRARARIAQVRRKHAR